MKTYTYETPENPMADAIEAVVGERPPLETAFAYSWNDLSEADKHWLQDWCSERARPKWATGLSMIEAAEFLRKISDAATEAYRGLKSIDWD